MEIVPNVTHGIVNRAKDTFFSYQGWPSVCRDENGTLYAVASSFRMRHVCPFGKTAMYISRNGGKTWTPPIVINDTYLDDRDAGILYMGNGRMLVTWFAHPTDAYLHKWYEGITNNAGPLASGPLKGMLEAYPAIPEEHQVGGSFVRVSEDYGVTWSETITIPVTAPHGPTLCKDGTLIYLGKEMYTKMKQDEAKIYAYASTDGGYTWECRGLCDKPDGYDWDHFHEPHVAELDDGTLYGTIRAQGEGIPFGFTVCDTRSTDGGRTWTPWRFLNVCGSPPHLLKHSSGALIMTYGRRVAPFGQRAIVSCDGGMTFSDEYVIDDRGPDGDLGYPCSVEMDDGSIMTVYYQKYVDGEGRPDPVCSILFSDWKLKP